MLNPYFCSCSAFWLEHLTPSQINPYSFFKIRACSQVHHSVYLEIHTAHLVLSFAPEFYLHVYRFSHQIVTSVRGTLGFSHLRACRAQRQFYPTLKPSFGGRRLYFPSPRDCHEAEAKVSWWIMGISPTTFVQTIGEEKFSFQLHL